MTINSQGRIASSMREYLDQVGDLPTDVLLGRIVLFTITDHGVPSQHMIDAIADLGLTAIAGPQPNKYLDAFKKATSDVKDSYDLPKGRTGHLLCRDVTTTTDFVRRQITREVRDSGRKRLQYDAAIEATFHKPSDPHKQEGARLSMKVNVHVLEPVEIPVVKLVAQTIGANYKRYFDTFDGQKIRSWVRSYLKKLNAVEIKGGVYFVPVSRDAELGRLAELVARMGGGCHMNMIPMVDLLREREFITSVFEREAAQALREITEEVNDLVTSRKNITASAYARMKGRYDEVLTNAQEHMETLQIGQDLTAASAEVALNALQKLTNRMLEDGES